MDKTILQSHIDRCILYGKEYELAYMEFVDKNFPVQNISNGIFHIPTKPQNHDRPQQRNAIISDSSSLDENKGND